MGAVCSLSLVLSTGKKFGEAPVELTDALGALQGFADVMG